ncbi:MAG: thioredoxin [Prolixibacteraceae bacterium]|nr:thioredoxin [Prolixibacteraceae bacterium]MBN2775189.1 thioredoxin [Prolixibacteraceae bacterium]
MNKGRFQSVINSDKPVLVDFYADWCMPCKQMTPILKELKDDLKDAVKIIKVNVDKNPFIATHYNIRSIPTIMLFKNGTQLWTGLGVKSKPELKQVLNSYL